jgi:hypothetical protein
MRKPGEWVRQTAAMGRARGAAAKARAASLKTVDYDSIPSLCAALIRRGFRRAARLRRGRRVAAGSKIPRTAELSSDFG